MNFSKSWQLLFFIFYCSFFVKASKAYSDSNSSYDSLKISALVDSAISSLYSDYGESIAYMDSSLKIVRSANRIEDEYWILQWRMSCERYWLKFDEFFETYDKMNRLNQKREFSSLIDELTWLHDLNLRVAHVYKDLGDVTKARNIYNLVYDELSEIENLNSQAYQLVRIAKMSIAELHSLEGNFDLASKTMTFVIDQEILQAQKSERDPVLRSNYCRLANYERLKGDYKSSYEYFKQGLPYFEKVASGNTYKKFGSQKYLKRFYPQFAEVCQALGKNEEYKNLINYLFSVTDSSEKEYLRLLNVKARYLFANNEWNEVLDLYAELEDLTLYAKLDRIDFNFYLCSALYELQMFDELEFVLKSFEDDLCTYKIEAGENYFRYTLLRAKLMLSHNDSGFNDYINSSMENIRTSLYNTGNIWDNNLALKYVKSLSALQLEKDLSEKSTSLETLKRHFLSSFNQLRDIEMSYSFAKKDPRAQGIAERLGEIHSLQSLLENKRDKIKAPFNEPELNSELHQLREERIILLDSLSQYIDLKKGTNDENGYSGDDKSKAQLYLIYHDSTLFRLFTFQNTNVADKLNISLEEFDLLTKSVSGSSIKSRTNDDLESIYSDAYDIIFRKWNIPKDVSILEIFADEFLSRIPFELLRNDDQRLISDYSIVYQPSYTDDYFKNRSVLIAPNFENNIQEGIERLLFNTEEVNSIKKYVPNSEIVSSIQNINELMSSLKESRIIHFATHSFVNINNPDYSYLLLRQNKNEPHLRLYQKEISRWDLSSEMVCLTSCDSGVGEMIAGDGMYSLARNFMASGAKSVISTLWSINDQSSSFIMKEFYKELKKGKRKDEALRQAKLSYLAQADPEYQHPYYWAAFVAMGDMSPLFDPYKKWKIGGGVLAALLLGGIGYRKYSALKIAA